jgi:ABC-type spermidine/putrescine transport system permease subunit II
MRALKLLAAGYALAVYAFIFLPVAVLVLFSFQGSLFPCRRSRVPRSAGTTPSSGTAG